MRASATLLLLLVAPALLGCGDSYNVTIVNECQETVDVQIKAADGQTVDVNGIESGQEAGGTIGLGPMDVKAVFPKGGLDDAVTGFKAEEGGEYRLVIRGDPPGIFVDRE